MSDEKKIFLFQTGQTFGPYNLEQLKELNTSGELVKYDLYWDMSTPHWKPVAEFIQSLEGQEFTPPAPSEDEIELVKKSQNYDVPAPPQKKQPKMSPPITTLFFDSESTANGKLIKITKNRCFIQSPKHSKRPPFVIGQPLHINFLSETTHNSINIEVKLSDIQFDGNYWISECHWLDEKPTELLEELKN